MSDAPGTGATGGAEKYDRGNAFIGLAQRPRLMLLLLAVWSLLGVLTQTFTSSGVFLENHNKGELSLDGALGGFAFGWEGIPLAALYIFCFRDPARYRPVFLLALIHMGALSVSQLYHWLGTEDFSFESVVVPLAGSLTLMALVLIHMFQPDEEKPETATDRRD
ncbi:MAG: hypothetical protein WD904_01770 [Dehalococcoidia bacterium]